MKQNNLRSTHLAYDWQRLYYYQSEPIVKEGLYANYSQQGDSSFARLHSYDNTSTFIYYLTLGLTYLTHTEKSSPMIQPLFLFYAITCFLKSLLLLQDPLYPHTTSVLQHGLTTRKQKKKHYILKNDQVKIQKEGLIPYFAATYLHQPLTIHQKFDIGELWNKLPEMFEPSSLDQTKSNQTKSNRASPEQAKPSQFVQGHTTIKTEETTDPNNMHIHPFICHSMISYVLSMLCRYDIEAWGHIWFTFESEDAFNIRQYVRFALHHFPALVVQHLDTRLSK